MSENEVANVAIMLSVCAVTATFIQVMAAWLMFRRKSVSPPRKQDETAIPPDGVQAMLKTARESMPEDWNSEFCYIRGPWSNSGILKQDAAELFRMAGKDIQDYLDGNVLKENPYDVYLNHK